MEPFADVREVMQEVGESVQIMPNGRLKVLDRRHFTGRLLDRLAWNSIFAETCDLRTTCRWFIHAGAVDLASPPVSLQTLHDVMVRDEVSYLTIPVFTLSGNIYDLARSAFRGGLAEEVGLMAFRLPTEAEVPGEKPTPGGFAACIMAASLRENWNEPVILEGAPADASMPDPTQPPEKVLHMIQAGIYNFDITPCCNPPANITEHAANWTALLRQAQPQSMTCSINGCLPVPAGGTTTLAELDAFMAEYREKLDGHMPRVKGLATASIISAIGDDAPDFDIHQALASAARTKHTLAGTSDTLHRELPSTQLGEFPRNGCVRVNLGLHLQNRMFEHPSFPAALLEEIDNWTRENLSDRFTEGVDEKTNITRLRSLACGTFREKLWMLPDMTINPVLVSMERHCASLFHSLNVVTTKSIADEHLQVTPVHPEMPKNFKEAIAAGAAGS